MATNNLSKKQLIQIVIEELEDSATYQFIDGTNPIHIMFGNIEYYIYIKKLSPAYFTNEDVWRAQMTKINSLENIKNSEALFILLGYDEINNVYATWNPHHVKQRIGTASSPSLYSRLSLQEEVGKTKEFKKLNLNNNGEVLVFPKGYLKDFLTNIEAYFPDMSDYVAMGSRRRGNANAAYRELTNIKHVSEFGRYLSSSSYSQDLINLYTSAIRKLLSESLISQNRRVFLSCDRLEQYEDAVSRFLMLDEIKLYDKDHDNILSCALPLYVEFLIEEYGQDGADDVILSCPPKDKSDKKDNYEASTNINVENSQNASEQDITDTPKLTPIKPKEIDYETPFIDENGNLTLIANPELIDELRPDLDTEYRSIVSAFYTVQRFYGDRFPNMEMHHWMKLFDAINWSDPYPKIPENGNKVQNEKKSSSRQKIKVIYPNGKVVQEKQVYKTLLDVIKYAGIHNVESLNIYMGNTPLITNKINDKYPNAFKLMEDNLYVNTCSDTPTKYKQITDINNSLKLKLKVELL